jgi:hypothetical protein
MTSTESSGPAPSHKVSVFSSNNAGEASPAKAAIAVIRRVGKLVSDECRRNGVYVSPLLAAYTARCLSLEHDSTG